jgi:RNA polymerase sigma-70 factor (ECF subfamily)
MHPAGLGRRIYRQMLTLAPSPVAAPAALAAAGVDEALIRAKAGDQTAFAALVRRYQNMVFSLALHSLHSRAAAEDLAQDVFLEFFRSLARIESPAHAVSWLRRVASHRCIDEIRRRRHRQETAMEVLPEPGVAPSPREHFLEDRLQALVATLPAKARLVVVLRFQEELDPSEIAAALNMPVNTVKSHLRRSLAVLRARLVSAGIAAPAPGTGRARTGSGRPSAPHAGRGGPPGSQEGSGGPSGPQERQP